jgi:acetyltransferase-like isoleucine patch superfamily enzyme
MSFRTRIKELLELVFNRLITHVPFNPLRIWFLRRLGAQIGEHVYLFGSSEVLSPKGLMVVGNCHIGRFCQLDARGGVRIGRNVVIASHCLLITADHDPDDPEFGGRLAPIEIGDRVWIGSRATILKGVSIGEGAVVAAGSTVVGDVQPWSIVGGVPAKHIRERPKNKAYTIDYGPRWY